MQRICILTTNRADYGIYRPLLAALRAANFDLHIIAGGTHPHPRFGQTIDHVLADAFGTIHIVNHEMDGNGGADIARNCGTAVAAFATVLDNVGPELAFVLGDRFEMLAAGLAAAILKIPLAHLHGGDLTEGAYDDQFRHALTKLAHLHFPAVPAHAHRILAMGEEPWRVRLVGSLAVDQLAGFVPEPLAVIATDLSLNPSHATILVTYHPETLGTMTPIDSIRQVIGGLAGFVGNIVVVGANADEGNVAIATAIEEFAKNRSGTAVVPAMTQQRFWSWMSHAQAMVGNSSSGIIESPSFRLPVVNVGDRQKGRLRAANVIDVACDAPAISTALRHAIQPEFRRSLANLVNPYGDGHAAGRIVLALRDLPDRATLLRKRWAGSSGA